VGILFKWPAAALPVKVSAALFYLLVNVFDVEKLTDIKAIAF
jgi:hypothetical protein